MHRILYIFAFMLVSASTKANPSFSEIIVHNPDSTIGVKIKTEFAYSCSSTPELKSSKIEGWKRVGFILGTEYKLEGVPTIGEIREMSCSIQNCDVSKNYQVPLNYKIEADFGFTFSLGIGSFTGIWTGVVDENKVVYTGCICCRKSIQEVE